MYLKSLESILQVRDDKPKKGIKDFKKLTHISFQETPSHTRHSPL